MQEEFSLGEQLGEGTYGQVFKAKAKINENSQKKYVIKKHKNIEDTEGFPVYALREISVIQSLNHENILKVVKVYSNPDDLGCLLFEEQQCDLNHCLKRIYHRNLPLYQIRSFMKQLFKALEYCHSRSIMHRDVKPGNILVDRNGCIKLSDFGCARVWTEGRNYTMDCGTSWYRAPEIFLKKEDYTTSVDIWSAGCVWWEILTGYPAFPCNGLELIVRRLGFPYLEYHKGLASIPNIEETLKELHMLVSSYPKEQFTFSRELRGSEMNMFRCCLDQDPYRRVSARQVIWELNYVNTKLYPLPQKYFNKVKQ